MDPKFYGIVMTWRTACVNASLRFSDFEDDIVGPNNEDKALYWIERTLEDVTDRITTTVSDMILNWLKTDCSKYLSFTLDDIGKITISKKCYYQYW